jgi:hypothetical protein
VSESAEANRAISLARIKLSQLPVAHIYSGPNNLPDFSSQSATFLNFRTRISDGMAAGPTFVGGFAVIQIGCGISCSNAFLGNDRTGELFQLLVGIRLNLDDEPVRWQTSCHFGLAKLSEWHLVEGDDDLGVSWS